MSQGSFTGRTIRKRECAFLHSGASNEGAKWDQRTKPTLQGSSRRSSDRKKSIKGYTLNTLMFNRRRNAFQGSDALFAPVLEC